MSDTKRRWHSIVDEPWKKSTQSALGHHKAKKIRKYMRHSKRSVNRTRFAREQYEPEHELCGDEYFD